MSSLLWLVAKVLSSASEAVGFALLRVANWLLREADGFAKSKQSTPLLRYADGRHLWLLIAVRSQRSQTATHLRFSAAPLCSSATRRSGEVKRSATRRRRSGAERSEVH